eukprot:3357486-Rhodomonas_salina.4
MLGCEFGRRFEDTLTPDRIASTQESKIKRKNRRERSSDMVCADLEGAGVGEGEGVRSEPLAREVGRRWCGVV